MRFACVLVTRDTKRRPVTSGGASRCCSVLASAYLAVPIRFIESTWNDGTVVLPPACVS